MIFFFVIVGCTRNSKTAPSDQVESPANFSGAPIEVRWRPAGSADAEKMKLVAEIERRILIPASMHVRLELPTGVSIQSGQAEVTIPANTQPDKLLLEYEFKIESGSSGEIKIIASSANRQMGVTATDKYSLGLQKAQDHGPFRTGGQIKFGEKILGEGIRINP